METFKVVWKPSSSFEYITVGYIFYEKIWFFIYTDNIEKCFEMGFVPFVEFPNVEKRYESITLFETFKNRIGVRNKSGKGYIDLLRESSLELLTDNIKIAEEDKEYVKM